MNTFYPVFVCTYWQEYLGTISPVSCGQFTPTICYLQNAPLKGIWTHGKVKLSCLIPNIYTVAISIIQ